MSQQQPAKVVRSVSRILKAREQSEGVGARVFRTVGSLVDTFDPFLLLDEFHVKPPAGFPDHPHRGFETITYMIEGSFKHADNQGNSGTIHTGAVQWMTAGRGLIHSEMPATAGVNRGLQLWVNLPAADKMVKPAYQDLEPEDIPTYEEEGVRVKVIAGHYRDYKSQVSMHAQIVYLDVEMQPGTSFETELDEEYDGFLYFLEGGGYSGPSDDEQEISPKNMAVLGKGNTIRFRTEEAQGEDSEGKVAARFVVIAGIPLKEPVARRGPFVMNTEAEIHQAYMDYMGGKF